MSLALERMQNNMFQINRTNTILYCKHWAETVTFYQEILSFRISHQTDWFIEFEINDNTYLSVADEQRATIKSAAGAGITLSWQVLDIKKAHHHLQENGVTVSPLKQKWDAQVCYFYDPEGNRIELWATVS
jgi:catechol-2,3-dioxygenase